ncbi:MAG: LuxR C-terminal-related transcriptional regulator [Chloroflexota bacterium]
MTFAPGIETLLTARQIEILRAYAETGSQKMTAHRCGVALATVRATLANVRSRLDVDSTVQAVLIVFERRIEQTDT